jgi:hypothetical protein
MKIQEWLQHQWASGLIVTALLWLLVATTSSAQTDLPLEQSHFLSDVTYGGTGCPQGTLDEVTLSADGHRVHIAYDPDHVAEISPETPPVVRQFCNVNLPLHIPSGWQYAPVRLDYRGHLFLDPDVAAHQNLEYYFQGQQGSSLSRVWYGPQDHHFDCRDLIDLEPHSLSWSPCGEQRHLTLKTSIVLNNRQNRHGYGLSSTDSLDAEILWRRCSAP